MGNGRIDPSDEEGATNNSLYESVLKQVVSKIRNEPFLFVIGVAALLVGLATLGAQIGSSDLRVIVVTIALLSFLVIVGYYLREPFSQRSNSSRRRPTIPPVFEASQEFVKLSAFSDKKELLIHPFEARIVNGTLELSKEEQARCESSPWDFDRIVLYLHDENSKQPRFHERFQHVTQEWEKLSASDGRRSLIPLHYAIRSILKFLERQEEVTKEAQSSIGFFRTLDNYLRARPEIDSGGQVKTNITSIIKILGKRAKEKSA